MNDVRKRLPVYDVTTPDGIGHTVWVIRDEARRWASRTCSMVSALTSPTATAPPPPSATANLPPSHRAELVMSRPKLHGSYLPDQLKIMDYNRVVKDLNGLTSMASFPK